MGATNQILKSLTALIGLALFTYLFVHFAQEGTKVASWQVAGASRSRITPPQDSVLVFQTVDSAEFLLRPLPRPGDTLLSILDSAATRARLQQLVDAPRPPWQEIPVSFTRDGGVVHNILLTSPPRYADYLLVVLLQALRFLITFLYVSVALWAFFRRPDSAGIRALALFSFSMAAVMIVSVQVVADRYAAFTIPFSQLIRATLDWFSAFFGAFWLNLILLFPRPVALMQRRPLPVYAVCYGPTAAFAVTYVIGLLTGASPQLDNFIVILLTAQIFLGLVILIGRHLQTKDRVEKRQTRLVIWGSGLGLGLLIGLILLSRIAQDWFANDQQRGLILVNLAFIGLLLSPVSFAYAFGRYRLLEVEARLRRGTRYVLATVALALIGVGIGAAGSAVLKQNLQDGSLWAVPLMLLAAAGLLPAARASQRKLERWVYPERQRLRLLIADFLQRAAALGDKQEFWERLEIQLKDGLMIESVHPVLRASGNGHFALRDHELTPFVADSAFMDRLLRDRRPLMMDEVIAGRAVHMTAPEIDWVARYRVAVILPLVMHDRLIGFLGLGMKTEREDYAAEELRILGSLSPQVAVAAENIRLLEDNLEKRRLEEQLQMARRIQSGFLPQQVPGTPGLEIAARTRFCLEVAGDYYDIIALDDGQTVVAVGDVSGKGAGAALLMANLQASLRTGVGVGVPLAGLVARINDLIVQNTPPEEYITFFAARFDPRTSQLTYVNAGHNPPLLLRGGHSIEQLDEGGLILGMLPQTEYRQANVRLEPGDLLLMYTDGVSEAMNDDGDEFGEARLRSFLQQKNFLPPAVALEKLEKDVCEHRGSQPLEDDFTIVLVRRTDD